MPLQLVWIGLKRYLHTARKVFFVGITFLAVFYLFFALVNVDNKRNAKGPTPAQVEEARRLRLYEVYDTKNDPKDEEAVLERDLIRAFFCSTIGELCTGNPAEAHLYREQSLSYKASGLIASPLQHPPSSFYYWAQSTLENAGFVPKTYAQGIGFAALNSFQPIWKVFRNLAYLVIVVVMMFVGFMVMFKVGGGGKNAVTLESALPKLVLALLAISMSYALAGLLIDVMYISVALIVNMLGPVSGMSSTEQTKMLGSVLTGSPTDLFFFLMGNIGQSDGNYYNLAGSLYSLVPSYMQTVINAVVNNLVIGGLGEWKTAGNTTINPQGTPTGNNPKKIATFIGRALTFTVKNISFLKEKILNPLATNGASAIPITTVANIIYIILGYIVGALIGTVMVKVAIMFILILGMIVIFFRLFFSLIMNYVDIILSIMIAPMALMLEAVPGQKAFVNWIRGLAVNLGVYPIVLVVIMIARAISNTADTSSPMWSPPFVSALTDQTSLQTIVAAVLIFSLPNIIKTYKQKLKPASVTESMGIGLGSLFVGASPILRGGSTVMGASGLTTAMAKRVTEPMSKMFNLENVQKVKMA